MQKARLIVENFGPLKNINIEVPDFLCLIGKQATGKSTIAKLISIFEDEDFQKESFVQKLKTYGLDQFISSNTFISYKIDEDNKNSILHFDFIYENGKTTVNNFRTYFTHFFEVENLKGALKNSNFIEEISQHLINELINYDDIFAAQKVTLIIKDFDSRMKNLNTRSNSIISDLEKNERKVHKIDVQLYKLLNNLSEDNKEEVSKSKITQEVIKNDIENIRNDSKELKRELIETIESYYYNIVDFLKLDSQYIPSERNFLHIIAENVFGLINNNIQIPKHLLEIGQEYEKALNVVKEVPLNLIDKSFTYKREGKASYIYHNNDEKVDLIQSASGMQSIIPIILLIEYAKTLKENYHFNYVIEEPELNIYPKTQHQLIKYLIKNVFDFTRVNYQRKKMVITTHSPYILASINNLLLAFQKGKEKPKEVNKIINKSSWINPEKFNAYELRNGKSYKIMNHRLGQLKSNMIDQVSDEFADEFDKILSL
jgi:energy-coupling factor transporter ATP-binding protein EcfA2